MRRGLVITHPQDGVYVGDFMGLTFWTQLDACGIPCVAVFETPEQAERITSVIQGCSFQEVEIDDPNSDEYTSIEACVKAGLAPWPVDAKLLEDFKKEKASL